MCAVGLELSRVLLVGFGVLVRFFDNKIIEHFSKIIQYFSYH